HARFQVVRRHRFPSRCLHQARHLIRRQAVADLGQHLAEAGRRRIDTKERLTGVEEDPVVTPRHEARAYRFALSRNEVSTYFSGGGSGLFSSSRSPMNSIRVRKPARFTSPARESACRFSTSSSYDFRPSSGVARVNSARMAAASLLFFGS